MNESFSNVLSAIKYGQDVPFSTNIGTESLQVPDGINIQGFISQDCSWACVYNKDVIQCFPVNNASVNSGKSNIVLSTGSYRFLSDTKSKFSVIITCATELAVHNQKVTSGIRKILLGLDTGEDEGALVIFDPVKGEPVKWISLPGAASCVTVLNHFEEGVYRPFYNVAMMAMVGVAAVGLRRGQVIIVDLGLDDPYLTASNSTYSSNYETNHLFPNTPSKRRFCLKFVDPQEELIAPKRKNYASNNMTICLSLPVDIDEDSDIEDDYYYYKGAEQQILASFKNKSDIYITAIEFIQSIGSLVVGFSFGSFQIWKIEDLSLEYSSPVQDHGKEIPIFSFSFQQPIDDPKHFCYLWVLYGKKTTELHRSRVELFSLFYKSKPHIENYGHIYQDLDSRLCTTKLTLQLKDLFYYNECEDVENSTLPLLVRPLRMWTMPDNLIFFSWEVHRSNLYYIGIFDLNQWYSAQTPDIISDPSQYNSFWVPIIASTNSEENYPWDISILPKTLERWEPAHHKVDIHNYPTSLSFQAICLTSSSTYTFEYSGIQERFLKYIEFEGSHLMTAPDQLKDHCLLYGLESALSLIYTDIFQDIDDRFYVLSLLLEIKRPHIIIKMASEWFDGSYANAGCTVDTIFEWISYLSTQIFQTGGTHWDQLYNKKDKKLTPETNHYINYSHFIWNGLREILLALMTPDEIYEPRKDTLEDLKHNLGKLVQFSAGLLMIYKAGILPQGEKNNANIPLFSFYEERRQIIKDKLNACSFLEQEHKSSHPLMIDYLLENFDLDFLRREWDIKENEELYPPKHSGYILNMLMWVHEDPKAISRVFYYYLMDLTHFASIFGENQNTKFQGDFDSVLNLSWEEQKDIYNLWEIDHGNLDEALAYMCQQMGLNETQGLPWTHAITILTAQGQGKQLLKLLRNFCPPQVAKIYLNITFSYYKSTFSTTTANEICERFSKHPAIFKHFFQLLEKAGELDEFLSTKATFFNEAGKEQIENYLKEDKNFDGKMKLLFFYMKVKKLDSALELFELMKIRWNPSPLTLNRNQVEVWRGFERTLQALSIKEKKSSNNPLNKLFKKNISPNVIQKPKGVTMMMMIKPSKEVENKVEEWPHLTPHIRKLLRENRRPSIGVFSPLRRYCGKILSNETRNNSTEIFDDITKIEETRLSDESNSTFSNTFSNFSIVKPRMSRSKTPELKAIDISSIAVEPKSVRKPRSTRSVTLDLDTSSTISNTDSIKKSRISRSKTPELKAFDISSVAVETKSDTKPISTRSVTPDLDTSNTISNADSNVKPRMSRSKTPELNAMDISSDVIETQSDTKPSSALSNSPDLEASSTISNTDPIVKPRMSRSKTPELNAFDISNVAVENKIDTKSETPDLEASSTISSTNPIVKPKNVRKPRMSRSKTPECPELNTTDISIVAVENKIDTKSEIPDLGTSSSISSTNPIVKPRMSRSKTPELNTIDISSVAVVTKSDTIPRSTQNETPDLETTSTNTDLIVKPKNVRKPRTSKSKTPELNEIDISSVAVITKSVRKPRSRSTRSETPDLDTSSSTISNADPFIESKKGRQPRTSRSKTPDLNQSPKTSQVVEIETKRHKRPRSTRSKTPDLETSSTISNTDPIAKPKNIRKPRMSRSKTPELNAIDISSATVETKSVRKPRSRSTRSETPDLDTSSSISNADSFIEPKKGRKPRTSRSKTPDLNQSPNSSQDRNKRSTRSETPDLEISLINSAEPRMTRSRARKLSDSNLNDSSSSFVDLDTSISSDIDTPRKKRGRTPKKKLSPEIDLSLQTINEQEQNSDNESTHSSNSFKMGFKKMKRFEFNMELSTLAEASEDSNASLLNIPKMNTSTPINSTNKIEEPETPEVNNTAANNNNDDEDKEKIKPITRKKGKRLKLKEDLEDGNLSDSNKSEISTSSKRSTRSSRASIKSDKSASSTNTNIKKISKKSRSNAN